MKIQAEVKEWALTEDGQLVEVAAKKKHSKMSDDRVTDVLPNSYIFSNAKFMRINKKDLEDTIVDEKFPRYLEGQKPEEYKATSFADRYFKADKETPASVIKNIRRAHPVITDDEQKYNPFIQRANSINKEYRQPAIEKVIEISEAIRPKVDDGVEVYPASEGNPQRFYLGGYTKKSKPHEVPKAFAGLGALAIGGIMAGGQALGNYFSGRRMKKDYNKELAKQQPLLNNFLSDQKKAIDQQGMIANASTAMKAFSPVPRQKAVDVSKTVNDLSRDYSAYKKSMNAIVEQNRNRNLQDMATLSRQGLSSPGLLNRSAEAIGQSNQYASSSLADLEGKQMDVNNNITNINQTALDRNNAQDFDYDQRKDQRMQTGLQELSDNNIAVLREKAKYHPYVYNQMLEDRLRGRFMGERELRDARRSSIFNTGVTGASAAYDVLKGQEDNLKALLGMG